MARRPLAGLLFALSIAIALPALVYAAPAPSSGGLIPCGVTDASTPESMRSQVATECEGCHLVQLLQKIIMFLIGMAIPIAVAMFAYAGFLYFTSGAGAENIGTAKKIFRSTLFGFIVAITAWLIINTLLVTLLDPGKGYDKGSWFRIECSKPGERVRDGSLGDVINETLGVAPTPAQGTVEGRTPTYSVGGEILTGTGDIAITEAWPPTATHKNTCHYIGTCTDIGLRGDLTYNTATVNKVLSAASSAGGCAVFETNSAAACAGISSCKVYSHVTAPHFSLYGSACK